MAKRLLLWLAVRPTAALILLATSAAGAGLAYSVWMGNNLRYPDEREYVQLAENLAAGRGYSLDGRTATAFRAPAYPCLLAFIHRMGGGVAAMRMANFALYAATLALAGLLGRRLGGDLGGVFASALVLIHVVCFYTAGTLYPQTLASFLVLLTLWLYVAWETGGLWRFAWVGLVSGLLIMTVSTCVVVPAAVVAWEAGRQRRRALIPSVLVMLCCGLVMIPWQLRNWHTFGRFVPFSTNSGLNLLLGNSENTEPNSGVNVDISAYDRQTAGMDEIARDKFLARAALCHVARRPLRSGVMYVRKFLNYFNYRNSLWVASEAAPWKDMTVLITYGGLLALCVCRLVAGRRYRLRPEEVFLLVLYLLHALLLSVFFTRIRFRIPFDSLLAVVGGAWLGTLTVRRLGVR